MLFYYWESLNIHANDLSFRLYFLQNHFENTSEFPLLTVDNKNTSSILFITFDNRPYLKYVKIHNRNIRKYAKKWNYKYIYLDKCDHNTYWCKLYLVLKYLNSEKYDYVVWLDSDTVINNYDICFGDILDNYDKDIFVGHDNHPIFYLINAGVFAIKNTTIGKQFIIDCIDKHNSICLTKSGGLRGLWAGTCYEQGVMNLLITQKYNKNTMILPQNIIYNYGTCNNDVFIMHLYGASESEREKCFLNAPSNN